MDVKYSKCCMKKYENMKLYKQFYISYNVIIVYKTVASLSFGFQYASEFRWLPDWWGHRFGKIFQISSSSFFLNFLIILDQNYVES